MSAFGYEVPEGYTLKSLSAEDLKAGMFVLISVNNTADFDMVESATPFVRPAPGVSHTKSAKCVDVYFKGSNWFNSYALTDRLTVAVPA